MNLINLLGYSFFLIAFSSGLSLFLGQFFRLEHAFSLFFSQALLISLMFIAGLIGIVNITSIILPSASIFYLLYKITRAITSKIDSQIIRLYFKKNLLVYISLIFSAFIFNGQFVGHNDEFNFWASSVKEMLSNHSLADASSALYYKMYHPGLTLYHYINLRIFNKLEPNVYISYLLLNLSAINVISHRFRNFKYLNLIVFICLTWLSYKALGLGFKILIADQYLINGFFACLFIILFSIPTRKLSFLIIPICSLALAKHPGLLLAVILLVLLNLRRFSSLDILNRFKTLPTALLIVCTVIAEIALLWQLGAAWPAWVDSHLMSGYFISKMSADNLNDIIFRFIHGNISIKEIEIFKRFIDALIHLKIGMPLVTGQLRDMRLSVFVWLVFCIFPLFILRFKGFRLRRNNFNLFSFIIISTGFIVWLSGIYLLEISVFQYSSEGSFPSMDRYIGVYLSALIMLSFSVTAYWGITQKNKKLKFFTASGLLALIIIAPSASSGFLNEHEITDGKFERHLFEQIDPFLIEKLTNKSKICILYNQNIRPHTYLNAITYGILPAHTERADNIASFAIKIPDYEKMSCTHFIGFCVTASDCLEAGNKFSSLFNKRISPQIWIKTYKSIKNEF